MGIRRVAVAIVMVAVVVTSCGLIPGSDSAGKASVPRFPVATAPPPNPPDPATELANLAAKQAASKTTVVNPADVAADEIAASGTTAPPVASGDGGSGAGDGVTSTTALNVMNLSETCLGVYRLKQVGFQLWSTGQAADVTRRLSLVQQVSTDLARLEGVVTASLRADLKQIRDGLDVVAATLDPLNEDQFVIAFADLLTNNTVVFERSMGSLSLTCPDIGSMWPPLGPDPGADYSRDQVLDAFSEAKLDPERKEQAEAGNG